VAFRVPALVTGLPANYGRWLYPPRLLQALPAGLPLRWRLLLPSVCLFCGLAGTSPAAGTSLALSNKQSECRLEFCLISTSCAFAKSQTVLILVNRLHVTSKNCRLPVQMPPLLLTVSAVVRAPSGDHDAFDRVPACAARLPSALVHTVLQLEKTSNAVCIYII
jgi:hypothetical protein